VSTLLGVLGIALSHAYWFRGRFHGATQRSKLARTGHTILVKKYGFDILYEDYIVAGTKGPIARAANWFNQNIIDGGVNGTATFAPLVGAALMMLSPKANEQAHKVISLLTSLFAFATALGITAYFDYGDSGSLQFVLDKRWIEVINSRYIIGLDGISLPLLLLTVFIVPLCIIYSWNHFPEPRNAKAFLILILVLETVMVGTFLS